MKNIIIIGLAIIGLTLLIGNVQADWTMTIDGETYTCFELGGEVFCE